MVINVDKVDEYFNNPYLAVLILESAKKLISDEDAWTKGILYRKHTGSYCIIGAIHRIIGPLPCNLEEKKVTNRIEQIMNPFLPQKKGFRSVFEFNDDQRTTHKQIMNLFDRAIKHYKEEKGKLEHV